MKIVFLSFFSVVLLAVGCTSESKSELPVQPKLNELLVSVKQMEDSLRKSPSKGALDEKTGLLYAEKCLKVSTFYPKSKEAPEFMDKAHVIFSTLGLFGKSVSIADSIIINYPSYKNRARVLESLASSYDVFIQPRKKEMVKKYYSLLLKENPNMPAEQKETIEFRLKNIDLTFEELIQLQSKPLN